VHDDFSALKQQTSTSLSKLTVQTVNNKPIHQITTTFIHCFVDISSTATDLLGTISCLLQQHLAIGSNRSKEANNFNKLVKKVVAVGRSTRVYQQPEIHLSLENKQKLGNKLDIPGGPKNVPKFV